MTDLQARFRAFAADPAATELDAALLVNRFLAEEIDTTVIHSRLMELVGGCDRPDAPWMYLAAEGFGGAGNDYEALDNSRLDLVLERRSGIPITLGVVLIEVARAAEGMAVGINFPGHFLVRVNGRLIDPFEMRPASEAQWQQRVGSGGGGFVEATPTMVLLRLLNNVKLHHVQRGRWDLALDVLDCQRAVSPTDVSLAVERSEFWLRLGAVEMVRVSLEEALHLCGSNQQDLAASLQRRLRRMARGDDTTH